MQMDSWYELLVEELVDSDGDLGHLLEEAEAVLEAELIEQQPA